MYQALGKGIQSNIMSVARGIALVPVIIIGNNLFQLNGVIWSMTASELVACTVGALLWISSRKKIMNTPLTERMTFNPDDI